MAIRRAVGVYLVREGRILLSQRGPKARHERFRWESVGGEVNEGETFEQAALRETKEELGVEATLTDVLAEIKRLSDETGERWHAKKFLAQTVSEPIIQEPEVSIALGWFTVDQMAELELATYAVGDVELLRKKLNKE